MQQQNCDNDDDALPGVETRTSDQHMTLM
jgi:hypothetical protein